MLDLTIFIAYIFGSLFLFLYLFLDLDTGWGCLMLLLIAMYNTPVYINPTNNIYSFMKNNFFSFFLLLKGFVFVAEICLITTFQGKFQHGFWVQI
jgi:hypothetical protein